MGPSREWRGLILPTVRLAVYQPLAPAGGPCDNRHMSRDHGLIPDLTRRRAVLLDVFATLEAMHGQRDWHWWPGADPFEVAVGSILVQNTAWKNVVHALDNLRAAGVLSPAAMAALSLDELETLVRPSGQFRQKARKLQAFLALAAENGGFEALMALPPADLRAALLGTWGIGPETADCIVTYSAEGAAFVIDAYTIRTFSRLGLGPEGSDYATWQRWFTESLGPDHAAAARDHALIVLHCKHICGKLRPLCGECALLPRCPYGLAVRSTEYRVPRGG